MTIKDRLQEALTVRGMTASDLANKSGINKGAISKYLKGTVTPKQTAIGILASALDVSPSWLLGYDLTMDGKEPPVIDISKLNDINKEKIAAYYQALIDSQEGRS